MHFLDHTVVHVFICSELEFNKNFVTLTSESPNAKESYLATAKQESGFDSLIT